MTLKEFDLVNSSNRTRLEMCSEISDDMEIIEVDYTDSRVKLHNAIERMQYYIDLGNKCTVDFVSADVVSTLVVSCTVDAPLFDDPRRQLMQSRFSDIDMHIICRCMDGGRR